MELLVDGETFVTGDIHRESPVHDLYIDVRGVHPIYVNGSRVYRLPGKPRDISVQDAEVVVKNLGL